MGVTSETSPSQEQQLPFPVEQFDHTIHDTYDREQLTYLVLDKLSELGIDPEAVVLCGLEASEIVKNGGFGDRSTTFAAGMTQTIEDGENSAVRHMEDSGGDPHFGDKPAIAVFWLNKLRGSIQDYGDAPTLYDEIDSATLKREHNKFIHWITADGGSLDGATAELFLF